MFYSSRAQYNEDNMGTFYQPLTHGMIQNQIPDGYEIVNAMKLAKIIAPKIIPWSEICLCPTTLKHERQTIYNYFLTDLETQTIDDYVEFDGESFFGLLKKKFKNQKKI